MHRSPGMRAPWAAATVLLSRRLVAQGRMLAARVQVLAAQVQVQVLAVQVQAALAVGLRPPRQERAVLVVAVAETR